LSFFAQTIETGPITSHNGNFPARRPPSGRALFNTDPGVYETGDPYKASFTKYLDQDDFLSQL
jgi:hypothetical protein